MDKTVYCGMACDILNHGHINVLKKASEYGQVTVGLFADSILNGYERIPINTYETRKQVLESVSYISDIIEQQSLDFTENLRKLKPNYVVHGDNWKNNEYSHIREKIIDVLKEWDGELVEVPYTKDISTSAIIEKIVNEDKLRNNYILKSKKLRQLLFSDKLEFIMEAHNGMSAKIVEEAGFKGIWASGLCLSGSLGLRDNNEASWSQVVDVLEYMANVVDIPILVDGDSGFGNFNNARIFCSNLEKRGIAGVVFEDKLFPKTNSFIEVEGGQKLADMNEFCGKIRACKEHQVNPYFVVVARLEAFIAGYGIEEAMKRALAYHAAGADAILVHSKISTSADVDEFMKRWDNRCPIVIVPTKYYSTPTDHFKELGISTVIWANHNFRSCIDVMRKTSKQIFEDQSLANVEKNIATVKDIFNYTKEAELKKDESKYVNYDVSEYIVPLKEKVEQEQNNVENEK